MGIAVTPPVGVSLPVCAGARDGYVVRAPPLAGKEEDQRLEAEIVKARPGHRFEKHSECRLCWQRLLDSATGRRHTGSTMASKARTLEHPSPLPVLLLAFGLVVISIVLILPR